MNECSCTAAKDRDIMRALQDLASQQDRQAPEDIAIILFDFEEDRDIMRALQDLASQQDRQAPEDIAICNSGPN